MIIDQSKGLESLAKHSQQETATQGIENYIQSKEAQGVFGQSSFGAKVEHYAKTKNSGTVSSVNGVNLADATYQKKQQDQDEKTVADTLTKGIGENMTAEERANQVAVLANTTSPEDLQKLEEDGFSATASDSRTVITETDKIKAVLAKAGVDISIYGDDLSTEQMAEITGSVELAQQIEKQLKEHDIPVTQENVEDMTKAYRRVLSMTNISEDGKAYLMRNQLEPTIENLYKAQFSGSNVSLAYQQDIALSEEELATMQEQMKQIVEEAGLIADEETLGICNWMVKNDIALTGENVAYALELTKLGQNLQEFSEIENKQLDLQGNLESEFIFQAMSQAIVEGQRPEKAMLVEGYSMMDQAEHAMKIILQTTTGNLEYCVQKGMIINIHNLDLAQRITQDKRNIVETQVDESATMGKDVTELSVAEETSMEQFDMEQIAIDHEMSQARQVSSLTKEQQEMMSQQISVITAQRQLAEIRLTMTVSANYAMLKKGIAIDIQPLEKLVQELKEQENQYYRDLLGHNGVEASEENVKTFADTTTFMQELKGQPAYILSPMSAEDNIRRMHAAGSEMQQSFEKAKQSYETLMTQPNKAYHDDISKAFRNVDDILQDLDLEINEANQRAVRILAYNETELTVENIQLVKAADEQVQRAFSNMTPAVTLEMIRRNINPLDLSIEELNAVAEDIKNTTQDRNEKFSKFLWKLERNNEITEQERTSYIGIYRLIAQVEKTDGAVIGSLLNQGADITMRNLLQAVRGKNKGSMDYTVDDAFGNVKSTIVGEKIDQQIEAAYQLNCLHDVMESISPEKLKSIFGDDWQGMTPEQLKNILTNGLDSREGNDNSKLNVRNTSQHNEPEVMNASSNQELQGMNEVQKSDDTVYTTNRDQFEHQLDREYAQEQLKDFQDASFTEEEVYSFMERYGLDNNIANILASSRMMKNPNIGFRDLFDKEDLPDTAAEMIEQMKETVLEEFGEAVKTPQEMADAQETLAEVAEHVMDTMVMEKETITAADLKRLRLMNSQFQLCAQKAKEESFLIPVQTGDTVSGISLKIVRGKVDKGLVDIFFRGELMGKVAASFEAKEKGISGTIAVSDEETRKLISDHLGMLADSINDEGKEAVDLRVALVPELSSEQFEMTSLHKEQRMQQEQVKSMNVKDTIRSKETESTQEASQNQEKNPVQTKRLYHIAESFIQLIGELTN